MGFLKDVFGDNRVLTAKDPEIQNMLTYMYKKYSAYIEESTERNGNWYVLRCGSKKYFKFLYYNGFLDGGIIRIPNRGSIFHSKTEAYEGLVWLYRLLEEQENNHAKDAELF
ncbi:MAG: hypothetical protein K5644_02680 [Lachnospiraceae bacterium]|nr:hypothetical protein [Lachnospiraceae bacterium]